MHTARSWNPNATWIAALAVACLAPSGVDAQVTELIDAAGDGMGNGLTGAYGVAVDAARNVYVTGDQSDNVFRIEPTGVVTQILDASGDGLGNPLIRPFDIALDGVGNVYVAGYDSANVFKVTPGGAVTEIIDAAGDGVHPLDEVFAIDADGSGNVYVAGARSHNVFRVTPTGTITQVLDASGDGAGNALAFPLDVVVDGAGDLYVSGRDSDNVFQVLDPGGVPQIRVILDASGDGAGNALDGPRDLAVDGAGNVFVCAQMSANAFVVTPAGQVTEILDQSGDGTGNELIDPLGLTVDGSGDVYVTGFTSDTVFKVEDPAGANTVSLLVDSSGDGGTGVLANPGRIAVDAWGNVYVTGFESDNAFQVTQCGAGASATFRNGGSNPASLTASVPVLGSQQTFTVDLGGTTGHASAVVVGYLTPTNFMLPGGQVVLANGADPGGELFGFGMTPGPLATFQIQVPNDSRLCGTFLVAQGVHVGGIQPFQLSNAMDLVLGL